MKFSCVLMIHPRRDSGLPAASPRPWRPCPFTHIL